MTQRILIVDDDARIRGTLSRVLAGDGVALRVAASAAEALRACGEEVPDLVLSDVRMPETDGLTLLGLIKERVPGVDVVLMTGYDDLATAATAMREGAADFLVKPLDLHQLRAVVARIFADRQTRARREPEPRGEGAPTRVVGRDPRMLELFKLVGQVAAGRTSLIIRGESGTGKEVIAREVHDASPTAGEPFIVVDCTALPATLLESELFGHVRGSFTGATADRRGRFALAGEGTILLDEIGDTSPEFQAKLLRVLQSQEFYRVGAERPEQTRARVMAATHRDLEAMVAAGSFREDLYYRLRVVELVVPPLRERRGDIPELARHLVGRAAAAVGRGAPPVIAQEAMAVLRAHGWPGNVRELENCLARAAVLATGGVIHPEHLSLGGTPAEGGDDPERLEAVEARHVAKVLRETGGNRTRAAAILGISRPRLRRLIERHRLGDPDG